MVMRFLGAPVKGGSEKAGAGKRPYGFPSESITTTPVVAMMATGGTRPVKGTDAEIGVAAQEKYPVGIA